MKYFTIGFLAALAVNAFGICDAQAANSIAFGPANKSCGGAVLCSKDGTKGYLNNGQGQAFKASAIAKWFQVDLDGKSHLKGQSAEPVGASGRFLVVNDTGRPISLFALPLGTDFNSKTPEVHSCSGAKAGKLCSPFTADDGTNAYKAQLSGADWDRCTRGMRLHNWKLCSGNPAVADFAGNRVTYSWRAKATGAIPKGATFTIDFSNWTSNAWAAAEQPLSVIMISVDSNGNPGNAPSQDPSPQVWTADNNNVAFTSKASNLPGSSSSTDTQYIYNVPTATLTPIPTTVPNGTTSWESLSGDGSLLGYSQGDTGGNGNDYLYNVNSQTTLTLNGGGGDRADNVMISGDGSYFIFMPIVDSGSVSAGEVWSYNVGTAAMTQMLAPDGSQPNNDGCTPTATNGNGEFVLLVCTATNLVAGVNYSADYIWDQFANTFTNVTRSTNGTEGMPAAGQPTGQLTPDGTYATFSSPARDLVAGGTMGDQVFLYNQTTQATELVSSTSAGSEADGEYSVAIGLSSDGRYNLFASDSPALGSDAGCATTVGGGYGVFVKDMQTGELECLSGSSVGATAESISGNGQYVVFQYAGQVYLATLF
ncbi:MAG: hypothetical protein ABSA49_05480 [Rhizomicrobium sp.]